MLDLVMGREERGRAFAMGGGLGGASGVLAGRACDGGSHGDLGDAPLRWAWRGGAEGREDGGCASCCHSFGLS